MSNELGSCEAISFKQRVERLCGRSESVDNYVRDTDKYVDEYVINGVTDDEIIEDFRVYCKHAEEGN